jgi:hypothetical protein
MNDNVLYRNLCRSRLRDRFGFGCDADTIYKVQDGRLSRLLAIRRLEMGSAEWAL